MRKSWFGPTVFIAAVLVVLCSINVAQAIPLQCNLICANGTVASEMCGSQKHCCSGANCATATFIIACCPGTNDSNCHESGFTSGTPYADCSGS